MDSTARFARNLRRERADAQLSQEALAAACDLHPTEISRLERARRDPRLSTIAKLADGLGVPAARLVESVGPGS